MEQVRQNPPVYIDKLWEVVCEDCGVIDAPKTRIEALRIARDHHDKRHPNKKKGQRDAQAT